MTDKYGIFLSDNELAYMIGALMPVYLMGVLGCWSFCLLACCFPLSVFSIQYSVLPIHSSEVKVQLYFTRI